MGHAGGWLLALGVSALIVVAIAALRAVWPSFGDADVDAWPDRVRESSRERHAPAEIDEGELVRRRARGRNTNSQPSEELPSRGSTAGRDAEHHG